MKVFLKNLKGTTAKSKPMLGFAVLVVGLLVAIPAMFGYNFLVTSIRSMIVECDNFAAELASEIEHRYVEY